MAESYSCLPLKDKWENRKHQRLLRTHTWYSASECCSVAACTWCPQCCRDQRPVLRQLQIDSFPTAKAAKPKEAWDVELLHTLLLLVKLLSFFNVKPHSDLEVWDVRIITLLAEKLWFCNIKSVRAPSRQQNFRDSLSKKRFIYGRKYKELVGVNIQSLSKAACNKSETSWILH